MNQEISALLEQNKILLELKSYKEMPSSDGYHMTGILFVNGKKAISFEDMGMGGGCDYNILNREFAKPLLDLEDQWKKILKRDFEGYKIYWSLDSFFYEMAEDLFNLKSMRRSSKKKTFVRFSFDTYEKYEYSVYNTPYCEGVLDLILKELKQNMESSVELWNPTESWKTYTIKDIEKLKEEL